MSWRMLHTFLFLAIALSVPATAPAQTLLVLNRADSNAALVDLTTYQVTARLPLGKNPHEVAISPDGRLAYAGSYGGNTVTVLDLERLAVKARFELGSRTNLHGIWVSRNGSRIWVTAEVQQSVLELDAETGEIVRAWKTNQETSHMLTGTPDDKKIYVANVGSGTVTVFDRETDATKTIATGAGAEGIEVSPDGREVWVSNNQANTVSVIDVASDRVVASFTSHGHFPVKVRFTPDGSQVWVANNQSGTVAVFDASARRLLATIEVSARPLGLLFSPDGRRAFVTLPAGNGALEIDVATRKILRRFHTGASPDGMAWAR